MPNTVRTYRFKLSPGVQDILATFSRDHREDSRSVYKSEWEAWLKEHHAVLEQERSRLKELGYGGDVDDKMYKAGRYYFRSRAGAVKTQSRADEESKTMLRQEREGADGVASVDGVDGGDDKIVQKVRRKHISTTREIRTEMDKHIEESQKLEGFRPAAGYALFVETRGALIEEEVKRLGQEHGATVIAAEKKLQSTYKNRYFMYRKKALAVQPSEATQDA